MVENNPCKTDAITSQDYMLYTSLYFICTYHYYMLYIPVLHDVHIPVLYDVHIPVLHALHIPELHTVHIPWFNNVHIPGLHAVHIAVHIPELHDVHIPVFHMYTSHYCIMYTSQDYMLCTSLYCMYTSQDYMMYTSLYFICTHRCISYVHIPALQNHECTKCTISNITSCIQSLVVTIKQKKMPKVMIKIDSAAIPD